MRVAGQWKGRRDGGIRVSEERESRCRPRVWKSRRSRRRTAGAGGAPPNPTSSTAWRAVAPGDHYTRPASSPRREAAPSLSQAGWGLGRPRGCWPRESWPVRRRPARATPSSGRPAAPRRPARFVRAPPMHRPAQRTQSTHRSRRAHARALILLVILGALLVLRGTGGPGRQVGAEGALVLQEGLEDGDDVLEGGPFRLVRGPAALHQFQHRRWAMLRQRWPVVLVRHLPLASHRTESMGRGLAAVPCGHTGEAGECRSGPVLCRVPRG